MHDFTAREDLLGSELLKDTFGTVAFLINYMCSNIHMVLAGEPLF